MDDELVDPHYLSLLDDQLRDDYENLKNDLEAKYEQQSRLLDRNYLTRRSQDNFLRETLDLQAEVDARLENINPDKAASLITAVVSVIGAQKLVKDCRRLVSLNIRQKMAVAHLQITAERASKLLPQLNDIVFAYIHLMRKVQWIQKYEVLAVKEMKTQEKFTFKINIEKLKDVLNKLKNEIVSATADLAAREHLNKHLNIHTVDDKLFDRKYEQLLKIQDGKAMVAHPNVFKDYKCVPEAYRNDEYSYIVIHELMSGSARQ